MQWPFIMLTLAAALVNQPHTAWEWFVAVFYIVWIDIVLAGDNAVVIALAVRNLPAKQRKMGILLGAGAAVTLRAALTAVTTQLLTIPYLKLIGGVLILWIAFKLLRQNEGEHGSDKQGAQGLWQAVWMILVADITMSLDNVMAVGGAARGSFALIIFGLALSIPLVVFGSNLISKLMARYQIIVFIGAAILGKVGGEMILTDTIVAAKLVPWWANVVGVASAAPSVIADPDLAHQVATVSPAVRAYNWLRYSVEAIFVLTIFFYGWSRRRKTKPAPATE
jgi:YjbE family integral membrane protein